MELRNWIFKYKTHRFACELPCSLYSILTENKVISDCFDCSREDELADLSAYPCVFEGSFTPDAVMLSKKNVRLVFDCIDTVAEIFVNGKFAGESRNMFCPVEIDVKELIKPGENTVTVEIESPIRYINKEQSRKFVYGQFNTRKERNGMPHIRKPQYMFGWDWAPLLPDMGLYGAVRIKAYNEAPLGNFTVKQIHTNGMVRLCLKLDESETRPVRAEVYSRDGSLAGASEFCRGRADIRIDKPELWYPRGYGEQPLYTVKAFPANGGGGSLNKQIGLRTVEIGRQSDVWGNEFAFVVNGVKIFAMGANIVPCDSLIPRADDSRLEKLVKDCYGANFNMIRIWGGGMYGSEALYDLCDRLGILVWQDFMFACQDVYLSADFRKNVINEAKSVVGRIANHPSLALLCGNNEIEAMIHDWAYLSDYPQLPLTPQLSRDDYLELFEHILPDVCREYAPDTPYWPCSPSAGGGFSRTQDENYGDSHLWNFWRPDSGLEDDFTTHFPRFCSEYGVISYPAMHTVSTFGASAASRLDASVQGHNKKLIWQPDYDDKLFKAVSERYGEPADFGAYVYLTQLHQADIVSGAIYHMRMNRERCKGSLYWQFNDCWPAVSWSSVDYYGQKKALYYAVQKAYKPVAVYKDLRSDISGFAVLNETPKAFRGELVLMVKANDFTVLETRVLDVETPPLSAGRMIGIKFSSINLPRPTDRFLHYILKDAGGKTVDEGSGIFVTEREYCYAPPEFVWSVDQVKARLSLNAKAYAPRLFVLPDANCGPVDNFMDILSGDAVTVGIFGKDAQIKNVSFFYLGNCVRKGQENPENRARKIRESNIMPVADRSNLQIGG
jgi:beta-mannosidase